MRLRTIFAAAACACGLALLSLPSAAAPKYVALQYDEIVRMVVAPATPPPPGSFADSYRQLLADAPNAQQSQAPPKHHGLAGLVDNFSNVAQQAEQAAAAMQLMVKDGHLTRYAYYNGWVREDDVVAKTATITKCAQHQTISLDLAKKTYRVTDTSAKPAACTTPQTQYGGSTEVENEAPGTANLSVVTTRAALGKQLFQNIPANGFDETTKMAMTNATGSCKNGSFTVESTRYISSIARQRAYCPMPAVRGVPADPVHVVVRGGCKPKMSGSTSGFATGDDRRLEMYSRMSMTSGDQAGKFMTVTQRGNVSWYEKQQADALFSIPAGFTQQQ